MHPSIHSPPSEPTELMPLVSRIQRKVRYLLKVAYVFMRPNVLLILGGVFRVLVYISVNQIVLH